MPCQNSKEFASSKFCLFWALDLLIKSFEFRNEAREMFTHAYESYIKHAYPADELMPLSCKGRYRDSEVNRGDVDDSLGNFSLTLIDSIDTLAVSCLLVLPFLKVTKSSLRFSEIILNSSELLTSSSTMSSLTRTLSCQYSKQIFGLWVDYFQPM